MSIESCAGQLGPVGPRVWGKVQALVWAVGALILVTLVVAPRIGLHAVWNVLIPLAPALFAIAPGLWRNICPLGTTSQLPRHFGVSLARPLPERWQRAFQTIALALLLLVVPLRHVSFNQDASATLTALVVLGGLALTAGFLFEGKSGWCAGLCPVHPVEKLYGQEPAFSVSNAHCDECARCTAICPDSTRAIHPLEVGKGAWQRASGALLVGGFPGYVWGWFQVRDHGPGAGWEHLAGAYLLPFAAMAVSLAAYVLLVRSCARETRPSIDRAFAAAAISTYYWFRLPALIGYGRFPGDGMLVDLTDRLPASAILPIQLGAVSFWAMWLVVRNGRNRSWQIRPAYRAAGPLS
jgi:ferredoxin